MVNGKQQELTFALEDILVYVFIGPSIVIYHAFERAKFIYFVPLIYVIFIFTYVFLIKGKGNLRHIALDKNLLFSTGLFIFISLFGYLLSFRIYDQSVVIRDFLILLSPLVVFMFNQKFSINHIYYLFFCSLLSYFLWIGIDLLKFKGSLNFLTSNYNTNAEFHNGVIFGGFFFIFLVKRKWLFFLFTVLIILMTGKRSIILGLIPAVLISPLILWTSLSDKRSLLLTFLFASYILCFFVGINILQVSEYLLKIFDAGGNITVEKFLMGREVFVEYLYEEFFSQPFQFRIFGNGGGQADAFLMEVARPDWVIKGKTVNPHNDYLKIFFDYGIFGVISFFVIFYSFYAKTKVGILVFFFSLGIFFVDNSFIFIYYWLIVGVISRVE
jgi:O-Antigen ligase